MSCPVRCVFHDDTCQNGPSVARAMSEDIRGQFPSSKDKAILFCRAATFAREKECQERRGVQDQLSDNSDGFDIKSFHQPEAFLFYARLTNRNEGSGDDDDDPSLIVHWEGLVTPVNQGAWSGSTILFFHMKELADAIHWTPSISSLMDFDQYQHGDNPHQYQRRAHDAFQNFALTVVSVRKEEGTQQCLSRPNLVVASRGLQLVSRDNRLYCHLNSRRRRYQYNNGRGEETWVYPRLVMSESNAACDRPGGLLGIRLVCNQRVC